jgi:hypothetical protein
MGDLSVGPCQGGPTAIRHPRPLSQRERGGMRAASQKLHRASCWPCKTSRLTWASEAAARPRRFAGRQVRCRLNRRAAVATSLSSTRAKKNPRLPCSRPIKSSEVGSFTYRSNDLYGRRTEASRDPLTPNPSPGRRGEAVVPNFAIARGFLGGVRPWLASVRPSSSTARRGVGSRRRTARRSRRVTRHLDA